MSDSVGDDLTLKQLDKIAALHSFPTYGSKATRNKQSGTVGE